MTSAQYIWTILKDKLSEMSDFHVVLDSNSIAAMVAASAKPQIGRKGNCYVIIA